MRCLGTRIDSKEGWGRKERETGESEKTTLVLWTVSGIERFILGV